MIREQYDIVGSVVIYNNPRSMLKKLVDSFLSSDLNKKLIVVDNFDKPRDDDFLKHPEIEYIYVGKNLGFGKGHNIAIKKYEDLCKYHVVLNPDLYFDENVLNSLYMKMEADKEIGLCIPKILFPDKSQQYVNKRLPTIIEFSLRFLMNKVKLNNTFFQKVIDKYELKDIDHSRSFICPAISGCFMFKRSNVPTNLRYFDDRFFMYLEDFDLSRRVASEYKTVVFSDISIYHEWARGVYKNKKLLKIMIKSVITYFNKWGWLFDTDRRQLNKNIKYYE